MKSAFGLPKKREEVVKVLQTAFTEGNLEEYDYENRLTKAYEAKSLDELKEVIYDFPPQISSSIFPQEREVRGFAPSQPAHQNQFLQRESSNRIHKVVMSDQSYPLPMITNKVERFSNLLGTLRIKAHNAQIQSDNCQINVDCWLGNTKIDLRNPELAGKEVHIYVNGGLGEVNIFVPPGTHVSRPIQLILGEFSHRKKNAILHLFDRNKNIDQDGWAFHLIIHGNFVMGSVRVRY